MRREVHMSCYVGIDIGAISATAAVLTGPSGGEFTDGWRELPVGEGSGRVYLSPYLRTRGRPLAAACELIEGIVSAVGTDSIAALCLTGSGSELAAEELHTHQVNEFQAIALGMAEMGIRVPTVFEMGGETSKYLRFSGKDAGAGDIIDYATNGDCAAGTGSFLDQQAGRLKYAIEEVGSVVLGAERAAQVAGRCSVFAKSDMIHAQQKGYSPPEVLGGLCDAVARNFRAAVTAFLPLGPSLSLSTPS